MPDAQDVTYTGARPTDALSSFSHRTIRVVYVPRSVFSFALSAAKGIALQDAGARGMLSAMGTPAIGASGAMALDWRVVTAANVKAQIGEAVAVLDDNASAQGARVVSVAVTGALGVDESETARQAAAAGGAARVPTLGDVARNIGSASYHLLIVAVVVVLIIAALVFIPRGA